MRTVSDFIGNAENLPGNTDELSNVPIDRCLWAITPFGHLVNTTPSGGVVVAIFHPEDPDTPPINIVLDGSIESESQLYMPSLSVAQALDAGGR